MAYYKVEDLQDQGHIWFNMMVPGKKGPKEKQINIYEEEEKAVLVD